MFIQIYSSFASPRSKRSKEVRKREAVAAKVRADTKIYALPSEKTRKKTNVSVSTEKKEECLCFYLNAFSFHIGNSNLFF